jgi:hypothetical protein
MNSLLIVLTCILVIIVIILADNLTTAMLIVSLLANFLVISSQFSKVSKNSLSIGAQDWPRPSTVAVAPGPTESAPEGHEEQATDIYGPFYEMWDAYKSSYTDCYDKPQVHPHGGCNRGYDIDGANAYMAQQRSRDKKAMDGWAVKDANFYKHHYGNELDDAENKPWWSRNEY